MLQRDVTFVPVPVRSPPLLKPAAFFMKYEAGGVSSPLKRLIFVSRQHDRDGYVCLQGPMRRRDDRHHQAQKYTRTP